MLLPPAASYWLPPTSLKLKLRQVPGWALLCPEHALCSHAQYQPCKKVQAEANCNRNLTARKLWGDKTLACETLFATALWCCCLKLTAPAVLEKLF